MNAPLLALLLMQDVAGKVAEEAPSQRENQMDAVHRASEQLSAELMELMQKAAQTPECKDATVSSKGDRFMFMPVPIGPLTVVHHSDFALGGTEANPDTSLCRDAILKNLNALEHQPCAIKPMDLFSPQPGIEATCAFTVTL